MAELVGAFAASHGPLIPRDWNKLPAASRDWLEASYSEMGRRLKALEPDVVAIFSPDHWVNYFLDNIPGFCIGVGAEHDGPPEPFMKPVFPHETLPGHPEFAMHLLEFALESGFDPAFSHRLKLDHGFCVPLWRMGLETIPAIVPVTVNEIEAPLPTIKRCLEWGRMFRAAVEAYPGDARIVALGTGGLSHSIGEPTMGEVDEAFDHVCIDMFSNAPDDVLAATLQKELETTGNGGGEVRNWVIVHAAAGSRGFDLIDYAPMPEIYVGCGVAEWRVAA